MTFSIAARCPHTGELGVGALTAMIGVGKLVTHAAARTGAIATQATMNPYLGIDGLRLLGTGHTAQQALDELIAADPGREVRQLGIVDGSGRTAGWTGAKTPGWSGHLQAEGAIAQGNRLVGQQTLEASLDAFAASADRQLAERLLLALEAGESTGADREGGRSANILVVDSEEYPLWDVRIDDADDPAARLRSLFHEMAERLVPHIRKAPTRQDPMGQHAREQLEAS